MKRAAAIAALLALGCGCGCGGDDGGVTLRFWAMGREGEVVRELLPEFERENPGVRVEVQQIPWTAAHEKLLTAHVGEATPDVAQLGNTWLSEFVALDAIAPLDARIAASATVDPADHFPGIWDTNVIEGRLYGVPWYVDTRVLFYRSDLLAAAGHPDPPADWEEWRAAMRDVVAGGGGARRYGILLPLNEWPPTVILGLQAGSPLLDVERGYGAFAQPEFRRAFDFYLGLFRDGLAPPVSNNEIANLYQEFARGTFAMYISGPWNLGEFQRRLPAELQDAWATAPLPGPEPGVPGVSLAGGSSLVIFKDSPHADAAWKLVEFLSRPQQQARFYELTGDLPAHKTAWEMTGIAADPRARAFRTQLDHVVSTPKLPEWEQIATRVYERGETAVRGAATPQEALEALDRDVARMLEKRRWLAQKGRRP
ncbi:MAG: ABC transporter substrate-binding protein [Gemmatimonas sp.]|nr:ABC transporter substrate-binding protein [Gemmatimonas sp.]